jgi:hypothetical protein
MANFWTGEWTTNADYTIIDHEVDQTWPAISGELYVTKMRTIKDKKYSFSSNSAAVGLGGSWTSDTLEVTLSNNKTYFTCWDKEHNCPYVGRMNYDDEMTQQTEFVYNAMIGFCYQMFNQREKI